MITLEKYFKIKGTKNLSVCELCLFNVKEQSKGWPKRYKDNQATKAQLEDLYYKNENITLRTRKAIKSYLFGEVVVKKKMPIIEIGTQVVYMIANENGRIKLGISEDPYKRANSLSTSSGYFCDLICYWKILDKKARDVEIILHEKFDSYRVLGEWFREDIPNSEIVSYMETLGYSAVYK